MRRARDGDALGAQPRLCRRFGSGPHGRCRRRPPLDRGRLASHRSRVRRGRCSRRVRRRVRYHVQPRGRSTSRHPHRGHHSARLRPRPRRRGGSVRGAADHPRRRLDLPGRHVRRDGRHPSGREGRRSRHRGHPHRLRRVAPRQRGGPRTARQPRRNRLSHRCEFRPRRVPGRGARSGRRTDRRVPRRHQPRHRFGPPHRLDGLQARLDRRRRRPSQRVARRRQTLARQEDARWAQGRASRCRC